LNKIDFENIENNENDYKNLIFIPSKEYFSMNEENEIEKEEIDYSIKIINSKFKIKINIKKIKNIHQLFSKLKTIIKENKLNFQNIIQNIIILKEMSNFNQFNDIYNLFFIDKYPTRVTIENNKIENDIEMECFGYLNTIDYKYLHVQSISFWVFFKFLIMKGTFLYRTLFSRN
jgi:hypothetical protein